jgi:hypothetical protein
MAHGLGGGEEMGAIFEAWVFAANDAHPNLMHQGSGFGRRIAKKVTWARPVRMDLR